MISPTRQGNGSDEAQKFPIASGVLGGFGGFLHQSFRRHDYLLGRRNAQAFLRWNFGLPESNPLFHGVAIDADRWHVRSADGKTHTLAATADQTLERKRFAIKEGGPRVEYGYPIIPLVDRLLTAVEIPPADLPRPQDIDLDILRDKIHKRAKKVIQTLVEVDLQKTMQSAGIDGGPFAWAEGKAAETFGAPFLADIATKKAVATIEAAAKQVEKAFE